MLKRTIIIAATAALLVGCDFNWVYNLFQPPPPPKQFTGSFVTLAINQYADGSNLDYSISDSDQMAQQMKTKGWSQLDRKTDYAVTADSFAAYDGSADMLAFDGHGNVGIAVLSYFNTSASPGLQRWGVGSTNQYIPSYETGMPVSGRLKWIVMNSSDSVAAPAVVDPNNPSWTADWSPAFGQGLHGIYGAWQAPGSCPSQGTTQRTCDIVDGNNADYLFQGYALPTINNGTAHSGATVHDAWLGAVDNQNDDSTWGIWEDASARNDLLSGPGDGSAAPAYAATLSGTLMYYYATNPNGRNVQSATVQPQTFTLNPQSLANESINDAGLYSEYASQSNQTTTVTNTGAVYAVDSDGGGLRHLYGTSGAVMYFSTSRDDAIGFDEATAQQEATNFVNQTLGMPSDATLYSVLQLWKAAPKTGSVINDGYEFIWRHSNSQISGGDAIKVIVSDRTLASRHCDDFTQYDPPMKNYCISWSTTVTYTPYVSYAYRLWRTLSGSNSSIQPVGTTSIDAQTAATALPTGTNITAYQPALWTPDSSTSSSVGARSVWLFTVNGQTQVAVDAYTGKILGSVALQ